VAPVAANVAGGYTFYDGKSCNAIRGAILRRGLTA
jgi:hypothetical protein